MDDLYQQEILHHFKNPKNYGEMKDPDITVTETNSSCGDSCTYYLKLDQHKKIVKDITFTGTGCAISKAASSMLTEHAKGKTLKELQDLNRQFMESLIGAQVTPGRINCLMLAAKSLQKVGPTENDH